MEVAFCVDAIFDSQQPLGLVHHEYWCCNVVVLVLLLRSDGIIGVDRGTTMHQSRQVLTKAMDSS